MDGRQIDRSYPGAARFILPDAATTLFGAHAFAGALSNHPLDLSRLSPLLGAGPMLYPSSGALGLGKVPILHPLMLPPFGLGVGQAERAVEEDDVYDEDEGRMGAGRGPHSWVMIPPGMLFLKQVVTT